MISMKNKIRLNPSEFLKYLINGGLVGGVAWSLQVILFTLFSIFGVTLSVASLVSVILAMSISLVINFYASQRFVFRAKGIFRKFLVVTVTAMVLISSLTAVLNHFFLGILNLDNLSYVSYPIAAIMTAPFVFLVKRHFVFSD